jgi:hypothetical protein
MWGPGTQRLRRDGGDFGTSPSPSVAAAAGFVLAPNASVANPETLAHVTGVVNEMAAKYGLAPITVVPDVQLRHPDLLATAVGTDHINLSQRWGALPPDQFNAENPKDAEGGCAPLRTIAIHEVGHIIEARKGYKPRNDLNAAASRGEIMDDGLDRRSFEPDGTLSENEALAYAFQAVECGSATPNEQKIYDILVN